MGSKGMIKISPAGSSRGKLWDDGGRTEIAQIFIQHGKHTIYSIQFLYVENGTLVLSKLHGCPTGSMFQTMKLNYPSEYITWISGDKGSGDRAISSLTFGTNQATYGPYGSPGEDSCKEFYFQLGEDGEFGGFYGTADNYSLTSIGAYFKVHTTLEALYKNPEQVEEEEQEYVVVN